MALPLAPGELEKETRPTPMSRMVSAKCTLLLARLRLGNSVRAFSVTFSWLFRGPRFGQILRVLALEQSSD